MIDAVTFTDVETVPAFTTICAKPCASLVAVALAGVSVKPPTEVFSAKLTVAPARGPPEESRTLKTTVELSGRPASPEIQGVELRPSSAPKAPEAPKEKGTDAVPPAKVPASPPSAGPGYTPPAQTPPAPAVLLPPLRPVSETNASMPAGQENSLQAGRRS